MKLSVIQDKNISNRQKEINLAILRNRRLALLTKVKRKEPNNIEELNRKDVRIKHLNRSIGLISLVIERLK